MFNVIKKKISGKYGMAVSLLASGAILGQGVVLLTAPVLTRIYSPDEFGVFALYIGATSIMASILCFRYEMAIPNARSSDVYGLVWLSIFILVFMVLLSYIVVAIGWQSFDLYLTGGGSKVLVIAMVSGFLFMGLYQVFNFWGLRRRLYKEIAVSKLIQNTSMSLSQILLGVIGSGALGMVAGSAIGFVLSAWVLGRKVANTKVVKWIKNARVGRFIGLISRYKKYPLYTFPSNFINSLSLAIVPFVLLFMFSAEVTGFYAIAHRVMVAPVSLIAVSIGQAFWGEASKSIRVDNANFKEIFYKTQRNLLLYIAPMFIVFGLGVTYLFVLLFGEGWERAGDYALILLCPLALQIIVNPLASVMQIINKMEWPVFPDMLRLLLVIMAFVLASVFNFSDLYAIGIYSFVMFITYIMYACLFNFCVKRLGNT